MQSNLGGQHFSFTLSARCYRNKQLPRFFRRLHLNLPPVSVPLNKAEAALLVPPAALQQPQHNTLCVWSHSFPKLLWYSTQLMLVNPNHKYQEQSLSAQSSSAGLGVRALCFKKPSLSRMKEANCIPVFFICTTGTTTDKRAHCRLLKSVKGSWETGLNNTVGVLSL